jgi:magnesium transporter
LIESLGDQIEKLEEDILNRTDEKTMNEIFRLKNELRMIRKNVWPIREVVQPLINTESLLIHESTRAYLRDLENLSIQVAEAIDLYFSLVTDQINLYQTMVSNRANDVMKVLTIFASIFIPLTFIAGIYGTNFEFIPELKLHWGYFGMWGVMVIVAVVMLFYFRRKRWL